MCLRAFLHRLVGVASPQGESSNFNSGNVHSIHPEALITDGLWILNIF
jgi:hypothetical protein